MSIITLVILVCLIGFAVYITNRSNWPEPAKWGAYAACFIVVLLLILRIGNIDLGSI
jgi:hypothetical protein